MSPLRNNEAVTYEIVAVDSAGRESTAVSVTATPSAGTTPAAPVRNLRGRAEGGQVRLDWESPESMFRVYRADTAGVFDVDPTASPAEPTFLDPDTEPGYSYAYQVTAVGEGGESDPASITVEIVRVEEPPAVIDREQLAIGTLDLSAGPFQLEMLSMPPPKKRPEWMQSSDSDGAILIRVPLYENREITARVRVVGAESMDQAESLLGVLSSALQGMESNPESAVTWIPAASSTGLSFNALLGEVTDLPIEVTGDGAGWFLDNPEPVVTVNITAEPIGYGPELTYAYPTPSPARPVLELDVPAIPGDVPAEVTLRLTNMGTRARRYLEMGVLTRHLDRGRSAVIDSDSFVLTGEPGSFSGYVGAQATVSGGYDPNGTGANVVQATLRAQAQAMFATPVLGHSGSHQVKGLVRAASLDARLRLVWQVEDGPFRTNPWRGVAVINQPCEVDLGQVTVPPGVQWRARIEGYTATAASVVASVDYLLLIPRDEGYARARVRYKHSPGVTVDADPFTGTTGSAPLAGRSAPTGFGTWSSLGTAPDWVFDDFGTTEFLRRTSAGASSERIATLADGTYAAIEVGCRVSPDNQANGRAGVVARWVDASNLAYLQVDWGERVLYLQVRVAGAVTSIRSTPIATAGWIGLRLVVFPSGTMVGQVVDAFGFPTAEVTTYSAALATGGALQTGRVGLIDSHLSSVLASRYTDDFYSARPSAEEVLVHPGRSLEIATDRRVREAADRPTYSRIDDFRGSASLRLPPTDAVDENALGGRIVARLQRNNVESAPADVVMDPTVAQVTVRPAYVLVPR